MSEHDPQLDGRAELIERLREAYAQSLGSHQDRKFLAEAADALEQPISAAPGQKGVREALQCAVGHIEHMAAWISSQKVGMSSRGIYSFESLGEDMPGIKAALSADPEPGGVREASILQIAEAIYAFSPAYLMSARRDDYPPYAVASWDDRPRWSEYIKKVAADVLRVETAAQPSTAQPSEDDAARLFEAIKHGDEEHRAWLKEAINAFYAGQPVPAPRGGGRKEARIAELEGQLAARNLTSSPAKDPGNG